MLKVFVMGDSFITIYYFPKVATYFPCPPKLAAFICAEVLTVLIVQILLKLLVGALVL